MRVYICIWIIVEVDSKCRWQGPICSWEDTHFWNEVYPDNNSMKWSEVKVSHPVVSVFWRLHGLYGPRNSLGRNTGVGSLSLLPGIFPTQGLNPGLPHCRQIVYQLNHNNSIHFYNSGILRYDFFTVKFIFLKVHSHMTFERCTQFGITNVIKL